ncbi:hypothetical protein ACFP2F_07930 [Hymenobacter artigasi]|uniref:PBECR3 domain-containing polyvalent protein n=1 Tax=Hymenobacter artigasi TaxID=2719616 RepID=UPI0036232071
MHQRFRTLGELLANHLLPPDEIKEGFCCVGNVSAVLALQVQEAAGLNVEGFEVVLDRSGVRHTLRQHGVVNAASEIAQGQVPIGEADFLALSEWLLTPQAVHPGQLRPGRQPMPCIEFYANLATGQICAILEFRPGRKRLALVTMYKKRPAA